VPKYLTLSEIKKQLKQSEKDELIEMICTLYKSNENVKQMVNAKIMGEVFIGELLEDYKKKIKLIFFPKNNITLPSLSIAKKLISDFEKFADEISVIDLMLYYVECGNEFTNTFGDINGPFYDSLCSVFGKFIEKLNCQESDLIYLKFKERIDSLVYSSSHIGWGYGDYISDKASEIIWNEEE
jgi:hypothetical protein